MFRVLLEFTTDVVSEDQSEMTTTEYREVFMEEFEDQGLDNTEVNCHKCLKASFKFRKVFFFTIHDEFIRLFISYFRICSVTNAIRRDCTIFPSFLKIIAKNVGKKNIMKNTLTIVRQNVLSSSQSGLHLK